MTFREIESKVYEGKKLKDDEKEFIKKKAKDYWEHHPDVTVRYPRWKKYLAWVAGYQNYDYNKITKKLVEVPLDRNRKLVVNKLRPYVRTLLAKLTSDMPVPSVIPNSPEDTDIKAARVGSKVIEGLSRKLEFDRTLTELKLWTIICNRAYIHVYWNDADRGLTGYEPIEQTMTPDEMGVEGLTEPAEPTGAVEPVYDDGDVRVESVSPFNCRPDPLHWERDKWRWFMYGDEVDAEFLEEKYGLEKDSLKETSQTLENAYELEMHDENDFTTGRSDKDEDITGRTVVWKELWTPKMYVFMAGSKVIDYGQNPFGEIPFYAVEDRLVPIQNYDDAFVYNESLVKDAIPLQREYNRQISIKSIALERASKLKVLTPLGSLLSKKQWVNDYGVFIDYNRNAGEPHQMKMDPFPTELSQYGADLERDMQSIMSLGPASFGQLPERASHASGTLVNLLLEQDDVILNPLLNGINLMISKAWGLALRIVQDNYVAERILKVVGEDGADDVVKFKGADLRGNTDVQVVSQAGLPRSRALRVEYILKMREVGLLTDDRSTLDMLEFGNADRMFKDALLHERRASRENRMIAENENIDPAEAASWVYPLEDHAAHLKIHLRERLGVSWDKLNDNQKQAQEVHIQATVEKLQPMLAPEPGQQSNEPGRGGPSGQPSRPATGGPGGM